MDAGGKRAASKKGDYFGTFLETVRESAPAGSQQDLPGQQEGVPQAEEEVVDPIHLLKLLRDSGTQDISRFQASTNLRYARFSEVVASLQEAGLVKISGAPGSEQVELLPAGATLAELG